MRHQPGESASESSNASTRCPEHSEASRKGLGLGLYICKELVTRQGGQIWVKRRPQKGSTFSFTLPVSSVYTVIAPLLKNDTVAGGRRLALVMVEASLPSAWPSEGVARGVVPSKPAPRPTLSAARPRRALADRAIRCASGALLRRRFTDEKGASSLANRIREQFERLPRLKQTGLTAVGVLPHAASRSRRRSVHPPSRS